MSGDHPFFEENALMFLQVISSVFYQLSSFSRLKRTKKEKTGAKQNEFY